MKLGYNYKIVKGTYWEVLVIYNNRELYRFIFDTEEEAKNKLNELI